MFTKGLYVIYPSASLGKNMISVKNAMVLNADARIIDCIRQNLFGQPQDYYITDGAITYFYLHKNGLFYDSLTENIFYQCLHLAGHSYIEKCWTYGQNSYEIWDLFDSWEPLW